MDKGIAAAGLLVLASVTPVLANAPITKADEPLPPTRVAEMQADCLPDPDSWLPGTLQIEQRGQSANSTATQEQVAPSRTSAGCAVV